MKDLLNKETAALMEEVTWEELGRYCHANQTLMVLYACWADWKLAFQLLNHLWKEGFTEDSLKLHYMMIQMLTALMPVTVKLEADDEEGQAVEQQGLVTRMVQSRIRRFLAGNWRGLWNDAQADWHQEQRVQMEEEQEASKL